MYAPTAAAAAAIAPGPGQGEDEHDQPEPWPRSRTGSGRPSPGDGWRSTSPARREHEVGHDGARHAAGDLDGQVGRTTRQRTPPKAASTSDTTGLKCAPDTGEHQDEGIQAGRGGGRVLGVAPDRGVAGRQLLGSDPRPDHHRGQKATAQNSATSRAAKELTSSRGDAGQQQERPAEPDSVTVTGSGWQQPRSSSPGLVSPDASASTV